MDFTHGILFNHNHMLAPILRRISRWLAKSPADRIFLKLIEQPAKGLLLDCLGCGDCGIQHVAAVQDFASKAKAQGIEVTLTAIDGLEGVDIEACEAIARDMGANFRRRVLDVVG